MGRESTAPGTAALLGPTAPTAPSGSDLRDRLAGYTKPGKATKGFPQFQKPHLDRPAKLKCLWVNIPESSSRLWEGPPGKWAGNGHGDSAARSRQGQKPPPWLPAQGTPGCVLPPSPKSCRPAVCTSQVWWAWLRALPGGEPNSPRGKKRDLGQGVPAQGHQVEAGGEQEQTQGHPPHHTCQSSARLAMQTVVPGPLTWLGDRKEPSTQGCNFREAPRSQQTSTSFPQLLVPSAGLSRQDSGV